jgi:hypothetical protein
MFDVLQFTFSSCRPFMASDDIHSFLQHLHKHFITLGTSAKSTDLAYTTAISFYAMNFTYICLYIYLFIYLYNLTFLMFPSTTEFIILRW